VIERRVGEAATDQERAVEEVIRRVPQWSGRDVRYSMIVGGLLNSNWWVSVEGEDRRFFVKIPGPGSARFIDRKAANAAARQAHQLGVGPEVVLFDASDGVEVCEYLEGYRACTNADFAEPDIQLGVIGLYKTFNSGDRLPLDKTIFDMIDEHFQQARDLGAHLPEDFDWLVRRYEEAKAAMLASGLDIVPCFNDPMPGNFLIKPGAPMRLVDYEFASNNERAYELGVFVGEMFFPEDRTLELIEAYYGDAKPSVVARVFVMRALADIKWASWAIVNRKLSEWDFDYQKYGVWKYMRARSMIYDPRWEFWLRSL
jgi:thiamine kinase-like enzyme